LTGVAEGRHSSLSMAISAVYMGFPRIVREGRKFSHARKSRLGTHETGGNMQAGLVVHEVFSQTCRYRCAIDDSQCIFLGVVFGWIAILHRCPTFRFQGSPMTSLACFHLSQPQIDQRGSETQPIMQHKVLTPGCLDNKVFKTAPRRSKARTK
jgi:hypothetical protein